MAARLRRLTSSPARVAERLARAILTQRGCATAVFVALCAAHAIRRGRIRSVAASEHASAPLRFLQLTLARYREGLGKNVGLWRPTYVSQKTRNFAASPHADRFARAPFACLRLFLANICKEHGLFVDAEHLYALAANNQSARPVALLGLADLRLLEASWAKEVAPYAADGIALDPLSRLARDQSVGGWRERRFADAIDAATEAVELDPASADAHWLLSDALLEAGLWDRALVAIRRYMALAPHKTTSEVVFAEARALFGTDQAAGSIAFKGALGHWLGWWRADEVQIVTQAQLQGCDGISFRETGPAATLPIASKVVKDGEILEYRSELRFEPRYVAQYDSAEILPLFGMVLANGEYLVSPSIHHKICHWSTFTPSIRTIANDRVIICRATAKPIDEPGCVFIGSNDNYYHWLLDELPRLVSIEGEPEFANSPVLLDHCAGPWQMDLLIRLGVHRSRFRMVNFTEPFRFSRLIAPSHLSRDMVAHPEAVRFMRARLAPHADTASPKPGKRLYLARSSKSNTRKAAFLNEREISEKFKNAGFTFVETAALSIEQQIELFADAEIIAGPAGAAMANALFAPPGAKLLALSPSNGICETFTSLACAIGQESWCCAGTSYARPYPAWIWTVFDFEISARDIDLCFERVL